MKQTTKELAVIFGCIAVIILADQICLHVTGKYLFDYLFHTGP